ncbi:hornerin isoform X2 [Sigmodon hispidus]
MPKLLQGIVTVIDVFYQYATEKGECDTLNTKEMKELLENEFHQILKNPDDPDTVDIIMQSLDRDHNNEVNFTEYLLMIVKLVQACNKIIGKDYCQASGSKQKKHSPQHQKEQGEKEKDSKEQDASSSYSSSSAGENDAYSRRSRGDKKQNSKSSPRKPKNGDNHSSKERTESNSSHFKRTKNYEENQQGSGSTQTATHSSRSNSRETSSYPQNGSRSEQWASCSKQGSGKQQPYGKGKSDVSSGESSGCELGHSSNYGKKNSGSGQPSYSDAYGCGSGHSSGSGEYGSALGHSSGSTGHGYSQQVVVQNSPQLTASMNQVQADHQSRQGTGLAQGTPLAPNNMGLAQEALLDLINMDPGKVSPLLLSNMALHRHSHQSGAQVNPPTMAIIGQDPGRGVGLAQGSPLNPIDMGLPQEALLALIHMDLSKVSVLVVGRIVLSLDRHQAMSSMALVMVSLPDMVHATHNQACLPDKKEIALGQDSCLAQVHMVLHQDTLLAPQGKHMGKVSPLVVSNMAPNIMGLPQEALLALVNKDLGKVSLLVLGNMVPSLDSQWVVNKDLAVVSLLAMVSRQLAQVSLPAWDSMALAWVILPDMAKTTQGQASLLAQVQMVLHWDTLLAPRDMDTGKVSHLVLNNMVLHQDSQQVVVQSSPQLTASMNQVQARQGTGLAQGTALAPNNMGLAQEALLDLINMDPGKVSPLLLSNMALHRHSHQSGAQVNPPTMAIIGQDPGRGVGLAQGSPLNPIDMGLDLKDLLALVNKHLGKVNLLVLGNMVPSLESQWVVNMDFAVVSLLALAHTTQSQASLLPQVHMVLHQDHLLGPQGKDMGKVNPLVLPNMASQMDSCQAGVQVSLLAVVSMDQDQACHQARVGIGLDQGRPMAPHSMGLAQEAILAGVNMGLCKVRPVVMGNMVLSLVSHQCVNSMDLILVSILAMDNTVHHQAIYHYLGILYIALVSHIPLIIHMVPLLASLLAMTSKGLDYIILLLVITMSLPVENPLTLANVVLAQ